MDRKTNINYTQKKMLREFLEAHPDLASGKFNPKFTFQTGRKLWHEITETLNLVPNGAIKEWQQWRKTWQDLKKNAKCKYNMSKRSTSEASSGPSVPPISQSDLEILSTIKLIEQNGIEEVEEKQLTFEIIEPTSIIQTVTEISDIKLQPSTSVPKGNIPGIATTPESTSHLLQEFGRRNDMYMEFFNSQKNVNEQQLLLLQRSNDLKEEQNAILQNIANSLKAMANNYHQ